jgi:hypothetical protein
MLFEHACQQIGKRMVMKIGRQISDSDYTITINTLGRKRPWTLRKLIQHIVFRAFKLQRSVVTTSKQRERTAK